MTPEQRLAYLLETVFVPTNQQVLFADVTNAVGLEAGALVVGTIKAASAANPLLETVLIAMSTVGLGLGTTERRAMVDSLAVTGEWPDAVRDAVKALGGVNQARWQVEGYETEPTLLQVTTELRKDELESLAVDRLQAFREALSAWNGSIETEPVL
jgi:hypothetical protein